VKRRTRHHDLIDKRFGSEFDFDEHAFDQRRAPTWNCFRIWLVDDHDCADRACLGIDRIADAHNFALPLDPSLVQAQANNGMQAISLRKIPDSRTSNPGLSHYTRCHDLGEIAEMRYRNLRIDLRGLDTVE